MMNTRFTKYDPVFDAQQDFRKIMDATARPGKVVQLKDDELNLPEGLNPSAALLGFALLNADVTFFADNDAQKEGFLIVNTSSSPVSLEEADFVFTTAQKANQILEDAKEGTLEYPETAASLIISVDQVSEEPLNNSVFIELSGPGVDVSKEVYIKGLEVEFFQNLKEKNIEYPIGVDTYLADNAGNLMVLPRSTKLEIKS